MVVTIKIKEEQYEKIKEELMPLLLKAGFEEINFGDKVEEEEGEILYQEEDNKNN